MGKIRRDLNNIKYIPYDNSFTLKDYCENYNSTLNDMIYEIQFENEEQFAQFKDYLDSLNTLRD